MRQVTAAIVSVFLACAAASAAQLGLQTVPQSLHVYLAPNGTAEWVQEVSVRLNQGQQELVLDLTAAGVDPQTADLRVLHPATGVRVLQRRILPDEKGRAHWTLQSDAATDASLQLSYPVKGLDASVAYSAWLDPVKQTLSLEGQLTLKNGGKQPLEQATLVLPDGRQIKTSLAVGQTLQQQLVRYDDVPYQGYYLYDNSSYKDVVRTMISLPRNDDSKFAKAALAAGNLRCYAPGGGVMNFLSQTALPYTPAGEEIKVDLGPAPEIVVTRTRLRGDQVNVRSDIYKKLVIYDLEEEYQFSITDRRSTPVKLVIVEHIPGDWQMVRSSQAYTRTAADTIEFPLDLKPLASVTMDYVDKQLNVEP